MLESLFSSSYVTFALALLVIGLATKVWSVLQQRKRDEATRRQRQLLEQRQRFEQLERQRKKIEDEKKKKKATGGPPLTIVFGTQTGTAEEFAVTLGNEAEAAGFTPNVVDMEDYELDQLSEENMLIIVCATYGEGEPPDNAKEFYEWLMDEEREHEDALNSVNYTVFGLGNRTYEHYNVMGRRMDRRLKQLGANQVYARGEGDDDSSLEEDFAIWKKDLWSALFPVFNMTAKAITVVERRHLRMVQHSKPPATLVEHWRLTTGPSQNPSALAFPSSASASASASSSSSASSSLGAADIGTELKGVSGVYDHRRPFLSKITAVRELHKGGDRSCLHIEMELPPKCSSLTYQPGDHVAIFPENDPLLVERVIARLNTDPQMIIELVPAEGSSSKTHIGPCSVFRALTSYCDLATPPRRAVLGSLARLASNPDEAERLRRLGDGTDKQGTADYHKWVTGPSRTLVEILEEMSSVVIAVDHFIELAPRLAPRYYSISSSLREHPNSVHATCVRVVYETETGRHHNGVCSTWFGKHEVGFRVPLYIRHSDFKMPSDPSVPILMIGPGTGLAPFRGFLQERRHQPKQKRGDAILFFGCRHPDQDFIYREELDEHLADGSLTQLVTAFSREHQHKVYVQHQMKLWADPIYKILQEGHVYICGDGRSMSKAVHRQLVEILIEKGGYTDESAEAYLSEMENKARFQLDVWQ
mmetsp:Transcript_3458/g.10727  ORF Transcript_3458/g.10727 Transcript_3458/m.10727 type:complete len:703 (-) Transcript_3458:36-2144(-)